MQALAIVKLFVIINRGILNNYRVSAFKVGGNKIYNI